MNTKNLLLGVFVMLTVVFASLTLNEYNQVGILNAQLQASTQTTQCIRTGQGYAFRVRVVADGTNTPVLGAKVNAISYTTCASGDTEWGSPITALTPDNGTVTLPVSAIGGYNTIINYQGSNYVVGDVFIAPVQITTVTLRVPSGNVTIAHSAPAYPLNESCISSSQGKPVEWNTAVTEVLAGHATCLGQSHNLTVVLTLKNGTKWVTMEPTIDDIFQVYKQCGPTCTGMTLSTE